MRAYYSAEIGSFLRTSADEVLGALTRASEFGVEPTQRDAWNGEIDLLKRALAGLANRGSVFLEFAVPRLGKRIDAVVLLDGCLFVLEFKVGERRFTRAALDQVWDYALDLKNFHETSHGLPVFPILIATEALAHEVEVKAGGHTDGVFQPICVNQHQIRHALDCVLKECSLHAPVPQEWERGRYRPTPTIVEAACALYGRHEVAEITRSDAEARNLSSTTQCVKQIIEAAERGTGPRKAICFVTGVPGAGKTLVGLNIATTYADAGALHSVFLSGNGPLVSVLREALVRDHVRREAQQGRRVTKGQAATAVKAFIQNVHHFRDEYLADAQRPPNDHVAVFDEAQRAWNLAKTADFMRRKKNVRDFAMSEAEFLVSCLDRHPDWAVIVCLVGGGQEINTGEAGISAWLDALRKSFPHWAAYVSPELHDTEYGVSREEFERSHLVHREELHLSVSMRSFRAGKVSLFVKQLLDRDMSAAKSTLAEVTEKYPILLTRDLKGAKNWLRGQARGTQRYGVLVSSQAQRLRPHAIDVRAPMDPVHWFLDERSDVRSSFYMEDVATEFHVQGLELDWTCVVWDGDFRFQPEGWRHYSFSGSQWKNIHQRERQIYLKNAYRVLLTRARQGMVIVVPQGDPEDPTRAADYYDCTYNYLKSVGLQSL